MAASAFLRRYIAEMPKYTDAAEVFHPACAYAIYGALLTRWKYRCVLEGGTPPRWSNLWVILVGDSGDARKSTALNMSLDILLKVDPAIVAPTDGSAEGFLQHLVKMHREQPGNATGLLASSEFSQMLQSFQRSYSAGLKSLMMDFFDVPPVFKRALVKNSFEIPQPRVGLLGAVAIELLPGMSTQEDWLGGFFSRAMLIHGKRTRTLDRARTPPPEVMKSLADGLWDNLRAWRKSQFKLGRPLFDYNTDALKVTKLLPKVPKEPNLNNTLSRASSHLMKLAAIEQIDEDPKAKVIGKAATQRALEYIMVWWNSVPDVIDECFARRREDFEGDRLAKRIHRYVLRQGGVSAWTKVMKNCSLSSEHMKRAINSLTEAGLIEQYQRVDDGPVFLRTLKGEDAVDDDAA